MIKDVFIISHAVKKKALFKPALFLLNFTHIHNQMATLAVLSVSCQIQGREQQQLL